MVVVNKSQTKTNGTKKATSKGAAFFYLILSMDLTSLSSFLIALIAR
jgi:hypothetical protein